MNNGKAKIENTMGNYKVSIPSKKNWFALIFGTAWMGGWYFGFTSAISSFGFNTEGGFNGFMTFWLIGWTIGGITVVSMLLWGYFGEEKLEFDRQELNFNKTIFGIGIKKKLIKNEIKNFRFEKINESMFGGNRWTFWGLGPGKIKFDYGFKTYSFGLAVDDAEANYLVEELNKKIEKQ
ncbi:hypothetical protein [Flammeovirga sp. SubArs3]|uniref:hypothetical protein n=1 Tax=Flammeovirga sp. SubArs3 TaxID=2995316 RepID=UPI00248B6885|nr:hypothetical protein [Flammeovirga sp. SubArs3]